MIVKFYVRADKVKTLIYVDEHPLNPEQVVLIDKSTGLSLVLDRVKWDQLPERFEQALAMQMKMLGKQLAIIRSLCLEGRPEEISTERQARIRKLNYI